MKGGKFTANWTWVWGFFIIMASLIMYSGYRSKLSESTQQSSEMPKAVQAVTSTSVPETKAEENNQVVKAKVAEGSKTLRTDRLSSDELVLVLGKNNLNQLELKDFPCPIQGKILREVGNYYSAGINAYLFHAGVDYSAAEGAVIRATHRGKVTYAGSAPLMGQIVTLDCGRGWRVTYGCLDNLRVQTGDTVEKQDALGQVGFFPGTEGTADQTQLHYEVWQDDQVQYQK